ncbi:MAG: NAD(P)/FAD-dependent oxidoreductase [Anaerolineae bacterium]|nr:NAD(P)/FAD-dependent oxidoreductase [Anaerolineae bacterium]
MKSIIIIGAGIAGLSAGSYGQMNGYRTQIFELHDKPGGLCTSWKRKGYTFDGCIHWLVGSKAGSGMNHIWQELGALEGRQVVDHSEFTRIEGPGGKAFIVYTDIDRLEQHMKELSPADGQVIDELCKMIRRFTQLDQATGGLGGAFGLLGRLKAAVQMLSLMPALSRYNKISVQEFTARFSDPFLRQSFATVFDMPDFPMIGLLFTLAYMHNRDAGYPIGGSLAFARAIERRYLDLGGEIRYKSRVAKILVEPGSNQGHDRAVGVRLVDGSEHRADVVISAADGHATIFDMLEGKYANDKVRGYYETLPIFPPIVQVSLGVARDLGDQPHSVNYLLDEPIFIAGEVRKRIGFKHYCYDPTLAPEGKSIVEIMFQSNHPYWKRLSEEPERYDAEKKDIAIKVIDQLEKRFPGFAEQVEAVDVATPLTYERYTGNWQGSMEGWLPTTQAGGIMGKGMDKTLPGLGNFYMIGQWVEPGGGLPPAATSARGVIEMICKQDKKPFETSVPSTT